MVDKRSNVNLIYFIDALVVILNISLTYTIVPFLVLTRSGLRNTILIFIINIVYLILRFKTKLNFPKKDFLFFVFLLISLYNVFLVIIAFGTPLLQIAQILSNTTFYLILYNIYKKYNSAKLDSLWFLSRGYIWFCLLNVVLLVIAFTMINIGYSPFVNEITNKFELFGDNAKGGGSQYFAYTSVFLDTTDIRIPFFQKDGILCGLFHEPHAMTLVMIPSMFLLLNYAKSFIKKIVIIIIYLFVVMLAGSTTNILSLLACLFVYILTLLKSSDLFKVIFILALIFVVFYSISPENYNFIFIRFLSGSMTYSLSTLLFTFTPKTIIGTSFTSYLQNMNSTSAIIQDMDVGLIIFLLNLLFLLYFGISIFKLVFSKNNYKKAVGFFALYFLFHSTKLALATYSLSMIMFVILIVNVALKIKDEESIPNKLILYAKGLP